MSVISIIPARMGSSRFPGKPLALINGKPMLEHVYKRTATSSLLAETFIATPDNEIVDFCKSINAPFIKTSDAHERASDRCAEALTEIQRSSSPEYVLMVQGDEPLVSHIMIQESLSAFKDDSSVLVSNLMGRFSSSDEYLSPNSIKVVINSNNNAMFFTRSPIPSSLNYNSPSIGKQVCLIPFVADFLHTYVKLSPSQLEIDESIDMLRILENGYNVKMIPTNSYSHPVDIPDDIVAVESLMMQS